MRNTVANYRVRRKIYVVVALAVLLGALASSYYLIYRPQQEDLYNRSAFRTLQKIAGNFRDKLDSIHLAENGQLNRKTVRGGKETGSRVQIDTVMGRVKFYHHEKDLPVYHLSKEYFPDTPHADAHTIDSLPHSFDNIREAFTDSHYEDVISTYKSSFESLLLIMCTRRATEGDSSGAAGWWTLYRSPGSEVDSVMNVDTLYDARKMFASPVIRDTYIGSTQYKSFLLPFLHNRNRFVAVGFISQQEYSRQLEKFPTEYLLIIAVCLVAVLCSLPFLKVFILGPQENITVRDVRSIIAMLYFLPLFFTLLISLCALNRNTDQHLDWELRRLQVDVKSAFYKEMDQCLRQLKAADSFYTGKSALLRGEAYPNADVIYWVNRKGVDTSKLYLSASTVKFFVKSNRRYFQDMVRNSLYRLPLRYDTVSLVQDSFAIEPVLSKSTHVYEVNIAKRTDTTGSPAVRNVFLTGLSGTFYSAYNPVLPAGFGFCLIDQTGNVLYHSQPQRNLQENLFEEADRDDALKKMVQQHDSGSLKLELYGKDVKLMVTPVKGLPYTLITYADRRPRRLYLQHVVSFGFFCEGFLLVLGGLLTFVIYYFTSRPSRLRFSTYTLDFAKPSPLKEAYYQRLLYYHGLLLAMVVVLLLAGWLLELTSFLLAVVMPLPFFSIVGYYTMKYISEHPALTEQPPPADNAGERTVAAASRPFKVPGPVWYIIIPYYAVMAVIDGTLAAIDPWEGIKAGLNGFMVVIQLLMPFLAVWLSADPARTPGWLKKVSRNDYYRSFILALMLSVVLSAMVPAIVFIFYANEEEKLLQTKSKQYYLAQQIQEHRGYINKKFRGTPRVFDDSLVLDRYKFSTRRGLYLIGDTVRQEPYAAPAAQALRSGQQVLVNDSRIYKTITQFLFLPADHSDFLANQDDFYYWTEDRQRLSRKQLVLHYRNENDFITRTSIAVSTRFPAMTSLVTRKLNLAAILALMLMFLAAVHGIIRTITRRISMEGCFSDGHCAQQDTGYLDRKFFALKPRAEGFEHAFWQSEAVTLQLVNERERTCGEGESREECILKIQGFLEAVYDRIWMSLSSVEKYVMYDFATDGFTNYKNAATLYALYRKELISKNRDHQLVIMNDSFRNYLSSKAGTAEIDALSSEVSSGGAWDNLSTALNILIFVVLIVLFFAQEEISKKLVAVVTATGGLVPIIIRLFDKKTAGAGKQEKQGNG